MKALAFLRQLAPIGLARALLAFAVGASTLGCSLGERAATCGRMAEALNVPDPAKPKTSKPNQLEAVARSFEARVKLLGELEKLPPDLDAISKQVSLQLTAAIKELRAAAAAKKAAHAPEYAKARLRVEEARRALTDLSHQFSKICNG